LRFCLWLGLSPLPLSLPLQPPILPHPFGDDLLHHGRNGPQIIRRRAFDGGLNLRRHADGYLFGLWHDVGVAGLGDRVKGCRYCVDNSKGLAQGCHRRQPMSDMKGHYSIVYSPDDGGFWSAYGGPQIEIAPRLKAAMPRVRGQRNAVAPSSTHPISGRQPMPNDLIERVARANDPVGWAWYDSTSEVQSDITQQTRVMFEKAQLTCMRRALAAIREPTER